MEIQENVMDEIFELLKAKTNTEMSWEERCRQTERAICLMRKNDMKEHEQYRYAIQSYAVFVGTTQEGSVEDAKRWLLEWLECHPEDGTQERLDEIGWCCNRLSYVCEKREKDYPQSIDYFKIYLNTIQRIHGEESDFAGDVMGLLAELYARSGDIKMACKYKKKYVVIYLKTRGILQKYPKILHPLILFREKRKACMEIRAEYSTKREG